MDCIFRYISEKEPSKILSDNHNKLYNFKGLFPTEQYYEKIFKKLFYLFVCGVVNCLKTRWPVDSN